MASSQDKYGDKNALLRVEYSFQGIQIIYFNEKYEFFFSKMIKRKNPEVKLDFPHGMGA